MLTLPVLPYKTISCSLAALLLGCTANNNTNLLAVPFSQGQALSEVDIRAIEVTASASARKASNPAAFLGQLWPGYHSQQQLIHSYKLNSGTKATIIFDGIQDDSVRAYRFDIDLNKTSDNMWQLQDIIESWRCWDDRGHQDFSIKPCA